MKSSLILATLATLAFGSAIAPQAQDDNSIARRALNGRDPLAADAASNLVARQAWADSDVLEVSLEDGSKRYITMDEPFSLVFPVCDPNSDGSAQTAQ
ncbi:hypothetical protein Slin14017_G035350 [Septoria linicola]|nr:hypothetical protein Slin14017_G035350 [Septoria linicola]